MIRACLRLGVAASLMAVVHGTALAPLAYAQTPGPDAVYLNDNNVLRGTLSEVVVGDHVTIQLTNGQTARVVWSYVARIDRQGVPQNYAAGAAPLPVIVPQQPAASQSLGTATVHIEGAEVALEELTERGSWRRVCVTPCDQKLSLDSTYQIVGDGLRTSKGFQLHANNGERITLSISPSSSAAFVGGIVLLGTGLLVSIIGLYVGAGATAVEDVNSNGTSHSSTAATVGWVMAGSGAVAAIVGVILWAGNGHTGVAQHMAEGASARAQLWKRLPTWHDGGNDAAAAAAPKVIGVPVFQASF